MSDENKNADEVTPNADELLIMLNSEEVKAAVQNLTGEASELVNGVLNSVRTFLAKLG